MATYGPIRPVEWGADDDFREEVAPPVGMRYLG